MKGYFLNLLDATIGSSGEGEDFERNVMLNYPLVYCTSKGDAIEAPAGFVSDGASVPRAFWKGFRLFGRTIWKGFPPFGRYLPAAVIHDLLCVQGERGECVYSGTESAVIFREACRACGVSRKRAFIMWWCVHVAGPQWDAKKPATV